MTQRGKNEISQGNLIPIADLVSKEDRKAASAKGREVKKKRKLFREIFEEILTDEKQTIIATQFVDAITDEKVQLKTRLQIFETILKILGESEYHLTSNEFSELSQHIKLEIV